MSRVRGNGEGGGGAVGGCNGEREGGSAKPNGGRTRKVCPAWAKVGQNGVCMSRVLCQFRDSPFCFAVRECYAALWAEY